MGDLDTTIKILEKPSQDRTDEEISQLADSTKEIGFFKKLREETGEEFHIACCIAMQLGKYNAGEYIFKIGDHGDYYCIVLKGQVKCLVELKFQASDEEQQEGPQETILKKVHVYQSGEAFGEMALQQGVPRTASMLCKTETCIGILRGNDYHDIVGKHQYQETEEKLAWLHQIPLFAKWSKISLNRLLFQFEELNLKKGAFVYKKGDKAKHVYIIRSGTFNFCTTTYEERWEPDLEEAAFVRNLTRTEKSRTIIKRNLNLHQKGPLQYFGDYEILSKSRRLDTCICTSLDAQLYVINKEDFKKRVYIINDTMAIASENHHLEQEWRKTRVNKLIKLEKTKENILSKTTANCLTIKKEKPSDNQPVVVLGHPLRSAIVPKRARNQPMSQKSSRVNNIIKLNKSMIGKSINAPSGPRWPIYSRPRGSCVPPPSFFASRNDTSRRYTSRGNVRMKLRTRTPSVAMDCSEQENLSISRSVSRQQDRRLTNSRHHYFRIQRTSDPENLIT